MSVVAYGQYSNHKILGTDQLQPILHSQASKARLEREESIYSSNHEVSDEEPGISKSQILFDVIKQLKSGHDLFRISLPAALLTPESMLEYMTPFVTPNDYILTINEVQDPARRFIRVVQWWLSNLTKTPKKGILHSKPYNPILGEVFRCKFIHKDSVSHYVAEQVCHHPPITSLYMSNTPKKFSINATLKPKSKFHGNSASTLIEGDIEMNLHHFGERYVVEFPTVLARGLIWSTQCVEIYDHMKISCAQTGYSADINFLSKSDNALKGDIFFGNSKNKVYTIAGAITGVVTLKSCTGKGEQTVLLNAANVPKVLRYVAPVKDQMTIESRRVWHTLTHAIKTRDYVQANMLKNDVEHEQREIRKNKEHIGEQVWKERYFRLVDKEKWVYEFYTPCGQPVPELEDKPLWKPTEGEIQFIKKHCPGHPLLAAAAQQQQQTNGNDNDKEQALLDTTSDLD